MKSNATFLCSFQTVFTLVFFCAFYEFLRIQSEKNRARHADETADGEMTLIPLHAQGIIMPNHNFLQLIFILSLIT